MSAARSPTTESAASSSSRRARRDTLRLRRAEGVPDEADRPDQRRPEPVELLAQVAHVRLDDVGVAAEVVVPYVVQDLPLRQDAPRVEHEEAEQVELGAGELDELVAAPDLARLLVQGQVREAEHLRLVRVRPPQNGAYARDDLGEAERLRHVVVADGEALELVLRRILRGEEDHRRPLMPVPQAARDREAVQVREHHVEDDQVGAEVVDRLLGASPGRGLARLEALVAERGGDGVGDRLLVVHDEDARALSAHDPKDRIESCGSAVDIPATFTAGAQAGHGSVRGRGAELARVTTKESR